MIVYNVQTKANEAAGPMEGEFYSTLYEARRRSTDLLFEGENTSILKVRLPDDEKRRTTVVRALNRDETLVEVVAKLPPL